MNTPRPLPLLGLVLLLALLVPGAAVRADEEGLRYPRNLAWRLLTEEEVRDLAGCPESLGGEEQEAPPLFPPPAAPLGGVEPVRDEEPVLLQPGTQWEVAPFPSLDPPVPSDLPEDARRRWEEQRARVAGDGPAPEAFAEVSTRVSEPPAASLRPRTTAMGEQLLAPESELPRPFSLRRYHTKTRGFFQIALYGGASGLTAERNYRTLRAAAPNREVVEGVGQSAFLSLVPLQVEPEPPPASAGPAFAELEPLGPVRLDLVDEGLIKAREAPSFQTIPVNLGMPEGLHKDHPAAPVGPGEEFLDKDPDPDPFGGSMTAGKGGIQVLVAFFPTRSLVMELALDDRIGDTQCLIRLAFLAQARLLQRW